MAFLFEQTGGEAVITGYEGRITHLQVPEEIAGAVVRRIGRSAFARRADLTYVRIPRSVVSLERFAFYYCPNLERVVLEDSIAEPFDGVFRLCEGLKEVEITFYGGRFTVLKELLSDVEGKLGVFLRLPSGEARLTFPSYIMDFQEDTFARAFHSSIVGTGYTCRECVSRTGVDFAGYDRIFERIGQLELSLAAEVALNRLSLPYSLGKEAMERYQRFVRENGSAVVKQAVTARREDWILTLADRKLLTPEAAWEGARLASETRQMTLVPVLVAAAGRQEKRGRLEL